MNAGTSSHACNRIISALIILLLFILSCKAGPEKSRVPKPPSQYGMKLEQYGITWYFDKEYQHGNFVNGDHYVIADLEGRVRIIYIDPTSSSLASRQMNGSQLNPVPINTGPEKRFTHGYDEALGANGYYDSSLNAALDITIDNPLVLTSGTSLVSTRSRLSVGGPCQLNDASVLTILGSEPPSGSFRPPYCGSDKTIRFNISDVNASILPVLSQSGISHQISAPDPGAFCAMLKRCWIDHFVHMGAGSGYISPINNMPWYGREYCTLINQTSLMACMSDSELAGLKVNRNDILIGLIQLGIDNYEVLLNGGCWPNNGGLNQGRKWPIMISGVLLGGATAISGRAYEMVHVMSFPFTPQYFYYGQGFSMTTPFAEDQTIAYVTQSDCDWTHVDYWADKKHAPYIGPDTRDEQFIAYQTSDLGMPEWGIQRQTDPSSSNKYYATEYRMDCTANAYAGIALLARIIEKEHPAAPMMSLWGNSAFFDFVDRHMAIATKSDWLRSMSRFTDDMWDKYRADYGDGYIGQVYINGTTVITNCVSPEEGYDGVTGTRTSGTTDTSAGFAVNTSEFSMITGFAGSRNEQVDASHYRIYGNCAEYGIVK